MIDLKDYTAALHSGFGTCSSAVLPKPAMLPLDRYEMNLRSDRPNAADIGLSLPNVYNCMRSSANFDVGLQAGKKQRVHVPGRGHIHCDILSNTRATVMTHVANGALSCEVSFNHPLYIRDPIAGVTGRLTNRLAGFYLDRLNILPDNSITVTGHVHCCKLNWPLIDHVVSKPTPDAAAPERHWLIQLSLASRIRVLSALPMKGAHWLGQALHLHMQEQLGGDDNLLLLDSIFKILEPGVVTASGCAYTDKPAVVHTDMADVLLEPQDFSHWLKADVVPTDNGVILRIHRGSEINSAALSMDLAGALFFDGRGVRGEGIDMQIKRLQLLTLVTNGQPGQVLLPLRLDSTLQGPQTAVAEVAGDFSYCKDFNFSGEAHFNLPAQIQDTHRRVVTEQGHVRIDRADLGLLVQGSAKVDPPRLVHQGATVPGAKQAQVKMRVRDLSLRGTLETTQACTRGTGIHAALPVHIRARNEQHRALCVTADYQSPGAQGESSTYGYSLAFSVPLRVDPPAVLAVSMPQGSVQLNRMLLSAGGEIHGGTHVRDPNVSMQGEATLRIDKVDGFINAHTCELGAGLRVRRPGQLRVCGSATQPQDMPQVGLQAFLEYRQGKMSLQGRGALSVPVDLPQPSGLAVGFLGGDLTMHHTEARLSSDGFTFAMDDAGVQLHGPLRTDIYQVSASGGYSAQLDVQGGAVSFTPLAAAPQDHDDAESVDSGYVTAEEDFD